MFTMKKNRKPCDILVLFGNGRTNVAAKKTDDGVGRWTAKSWQILAKFRKCVASNASDYVARELAGWFGGRIGTVIK
jgi:hypothetical protein